MRLPTKTTRQALYEDARVMHERLWAAFLKGERVVLASTADDVARDAQQTESNLHKFWRARGYRVRYKTAKDRSMFVMWLELVAQRQVA